MSIFIRNLKRQTFTPILKRNFVSRISGNTPSLPVTTKGLYILAGAGAFLGLVTIINKGLSIKSDDFISPNYFPQHIRNRLFSTYGHVTMGLASTAAWAFLLFRSGVAIKLAQYNPIALTLGFFALSLGSMIATRSIDYQKSPFMKHASWTAFNLFIGLSLCPLGVLGGPLLLRAAIATGTIIGSLSAVAAVSPSEAFLNWGGALGVGFGVLLAASIGQMFFPSPLLYNLTLYGGLGLFSLFTLFDTQVLIKNCQIPGEFDPINASFGIYMNAINIFVRMAMILSNNRRK